MIFTEHPWYNEPGREAGIKNAFYSLGEKGDNSVTALITSATDASPCFAKINTKPFSGFAQSITQQLSPANTHDVVRRAQNSNVQLYFPSTDDGS